MGKLRSVLLLLVATLLVSTAALAAQECLETDGGDNIYLMGTVSHPGSKEVSDVQEDVCFDGKYLYEQNCDGGRKVFCQHGCSDGRCRSFGDIVEPTSECQDTDPEDNPYFKGSLSTEADYYGGVREDYCADSMTVFEQNCNGGQVVACEAGCADGRCKPSGSVGAQQDVCLDSDGGDNFFAKGRVSFSQDVREVYPDYCANSVTLIEQTCQGALEVSCPRGCSDGDCVAEPAILVGPAAAEKILSQADLDRLANAGAPEEVAPQEEAAPEAPAQEPAAAPETGAGKNKVWLWVVIIVVVAAVLFFALQDKKKK